MNKDKGPRQLLEMDLKEILEHTSFPYIVWILQVVSTCLLFDLFVLGEKGRYCIIEYNDRSAFCGGMAFFFTGCFVFLAIVTFVLHLRINKSIQKGEFKRLGFKIKFFNHPLFETSSGKIIYIVGVLLIFYFLWGR